MTSQVSSLFKTVSVVCRAKGDLEVFMRSNGTNFTFRTYRSFNDSSAACGRDLSVAAVFGRTVTWR